MRPDPSLDAARRRTLRPRLHLGGSLLVLSLVGCASYNEKVEHALDAYEQGRLDEAQRLFGEEKVADSAFLNGAEAGMVAFTAGDFDAARAYFTDAAEEVRDLEEEALVSPEAVIETTLKWTLSERHAPYKGEGYERVMLHALLGLSYLADFQLEEALVELKRADELLTGEERLYERQYGAGGLGHFVSALVYELLGEEDEAYLDYQRMHEKGLGGELVGPALVRLARELGRDQEERDWQSVYGPVGEAPERAAKIVLIGGIGLGPYKVEDRLDLALSDGIFSASVPRVRQRTPKVDELALEVDGTNVWSTMIEDVGRVMDENLSDRLGFLQTRAILRGFIKLHLQQMAHDDIGPVGLVAVAILSVASEGADLRAWTTLPDNWQVARALVEPGVHSVTVRALGGDPHPLGVYVLEPGESLIIYARTLGGRLWAYPIGGLRLDESELEALATVEASAPVAVRPADADDASSAARPADAEADRAP